MSSKKETIYVKGGGNIVSFPSGDEGLYIDIDLNNLQQVLKNNPEVKSWSRTSFVREQACRGSSNVIGGSNINCHVFIIRGCGKVAGKSTVVANTLAASVFGPASQ